MPTNSSTKTRRAAARKTKSAPARTSKTDAITLLKEDHRQVEEWFEEYEDLENDVEKGELAAKICQALKVRAGTRGGDLYEGLGVKQDAVLLCAAMTAALEGLNCREPVLAAFSIERGRSTLCSPCAWRINLYPAAP